MLALKIVGGLAVLAVVAVVVVAVIVIFFTDYSK
jgi:hypothetical protein